MSQPIRACGGHLGFLIGSKNTILVEGIECLLHTCHCPARDKNCPAFSTEKNCPGRDTENPDFWTYHKKKFQRNIDFSVSISSRFFFSKTLFI